MFKRHIRRRNKGLFSWISDLFLVAAGIVFFCGEFYVIPLGRANARCNLPDNYGNFEKNIRKIESSEPKDSFSFAVVGDPQSSPTFEGLCEKLRDERLAFIVITGDFCKRCTKSYHDFFIHQCANTYGLSVPVFLMPGNRDVDYDSTYGDNISMSQFRSMYGSENFCFEYSGCLFVGVCTFPSHVSSADGAEYLEKTLSARRKQGQRVFVFTHVPPDPAPSLETKSFHEKDTFMDIVSRYKVDYVIASHYHGYSRSQRDNTVYLITGGGGADLKERESFNGLHHAMVFTVQPNCVSERPVLTERRRIGANPFVYLSLTEFCPLLRLHPCVSIAVNIAVLVVLCLAVGNCVSRITAGRKVNNENVSS